MLRALFGSESTERILVYIYARQKGFPSEIANFYNSSLTPIQQKLNKLEEGGILVSFYAGRTLLYSFNPRYPFLLELKALLMKALDYYPEDIKRITDHKSQKAKAKGKTIMKPIIEMSQLEIGAYVQSHLAQNGVRVVLSGGASVSYYTNAKYISRDLDMVNLIGVDRKRSKH